MAKVLPHRLVPGKRLSAVPAGNVLGWLATVMTHQEKQGLTGLQQVSERKDSRLGRGQ